ncbi:MAG: hypothetical protein OHK0013_03050 [Sandaracinaceae bacterium]
MPRPRTQALVAPLALALAACGARAVDATPVGAVRAFLAALERADDPHAREEAYRLLCPAAQIALAERARDAAALGGRTFAPWEMIVEERVRVRHAPRRGSAFQERAVTDDPDRRLVDVTDESGAVRSVATRRVEGSWCVELSVPAAEPG